MGLSTQHRSGIPPSRRARPRFDRRRRRRRPVRRRDLPDRRHRYARRCQWAGGRRNRYRCRGISIGHRHARQHSSRPQPRRRRVVSSRPGRDPTRVRAVRQRHQYLHGRDVPGGVRRQAERHLRPRRPEMPGQDHSEDLRTADRTLRRHGLRRFRVHGRRGRRCRGVYRSASRRLRTRRRAAQRRYPTHRRTHRTELRPSPEHRIGGQRRLRPDQAPAALPVVAVAIGVVEQGASRPGQAERIRQRVHLRHLRRERQDPGSGDARPIAAERRRRRGDLPDHSHHRNQRLRQRDPQRRRHRRHLPGHHRRSTVARRRTGGTGDTGTDPAARRSRGPAAGRGSGHRVAAGVQRVGHRGNGTDRVRSAGDVRIPDPHGR
ncbi:unannotated protein [freshwater metagenome]|uniref:Unannotated protein n=1 Tax=freshwater metagenome TaxID=449393 RepID=A0A6J7IUR6_9ZZZZ